MGFREEILKRVEKSKDLPTLPSVFIKLDKLLANKHTSAMDIASLIKDDVALTTRILRVSNSAAFGGSIQITSVSQAVTRLGFRQLADLAKSVSMLGVFKGAGAIDVKKFWLHSLCVASTCEIIPRFAGKMCKDQDSLFTAGLLHDVGIFIMELFTGDLYKSAVTMAADTGQMLVKAEQRLMQIDHAEVGSLVLTKWGIPEIIAKAAKHHHDAITPPEAPISLSAVVQIANLICNDQGIDNGTGTQLEKIPENGWEGLGIQQADVPVLKAELQKIITRSSSMLDAAT